MNRYTVYYIIYFISLILCVSCKKDKDQTIHDDVAISPQYSVALGNFSFDMNDELNKLRNILGQFPDSILYNEELLYSPYVLDDTVTMPFNFSGISEDFDNISLLGLKLIFYNGYPTNISVEASLNDLSGNEIYRTRSYEIPASPIDDNYRVIEPSKSPFEFNFPDSVIPELTQVVAINFYYTVDTQSSEEILTRFYSEYDIKLHVGARVQVELSL